MTYEERLSVLKQKVISLRKQGRVTSWPEEIKNEALFLYEEFGLKKFLNHVPLAAPILYKWKYKRKEIEKVSNKKTIAEHKIEITRVSANNFQTPSSLTSIEPVATIENKSMKIHIFSEKIALNIIESLAK